MSVSIGEAFGYWVVLGPGPVYRRPSHRSGGERRWYCRCRCGKERIVHECLLLNGRSTSCSCSRWKNSLASIMGQLIITEAGCAVWPGSKHGGYGVTTLEGKQYYVHRLLYERFVGPVPEGRVLDHIVCDNRACANFTHLRVCTDGENVMRADTPISRNARKTHCPHGHPYAGENLRLNPDGSRGCRTCERLQRRKKQP